MNEVKKRDWPYLVISIGIFVLMITLMGGNQFPLTEGAEMDIDPSIKMAPYMDLVTGLYGYIDIEGQIVIEPRYQYADVFNEGVAVVAESNSKGTFYGYIDRKGDVVLPFKYDYARAYSEGLAVVSQDGSVLVINKSGDAAFKVPEGSMVGDYSNGLAPVYPLKDADESETLSGYMDRNGKLVIDLPIIKGMSFEDGLAQVFLSKDGKRGWGYIDAKGTLVIEPKYISSEPFSEGVAAVAVRDADGNKKWGYINAKGDYVIDPVFDSAFAFSENLAVVYIDDMGYGYIDRNGTVVIGPGFKMATAFSNGYANVRKNSTEFHCIDKTGEQLFSVENMLIFEFK